MKTTCLILFLLFLFVGAYTQQLSQVTFNNGTNLACFALTTNENLLIRISESGKVLEWGTEERSLYNNNYFAPKLLPYMGRVEYYGLESDSVYRGKIKSIGANTISYYGSGEYDTKIGKIKSINNLLFDYYSVFDDHLLVGKLKNIGNNSISYYTSFDNEAFKGKLKTLGNTIITYYASFDDKLIKGKIKNIGGFNYAWFTSFDQREYGGGLKSGALRQMINTVTYILW